MELARVFGIGLLIHLLTGVRVDKETESPEKRCPQEKQSKKMPHQQAGARETLRIALARAHGAAHGAYRGHSNRGIDITRLRGERESLVGVGNAGVRCSPIGNVGGRCARRNRCGGYNRSRGLNPGGRIGRARSLDTRFLKRLGGLHETGRAISLRQHAAIEASSREGLGGVLHIVRVRTRRHRRHRTERRNRLGLG